MRTATKRRTKPAELLEEHYRRVLLEHLQNPSEATLGQAYELGRTAMAAGKSLLELAALHHRALEKILSSRTDARFQREVP